MPLPKFITALRMLKLGVTVKLGKTKMDYLFAVKLFGNISGRKMLKLSKDIGKKTDNPKIIILINYNKKSK